MLLTRILRSALVALPLAAAPLSACAKPDWSEQRLSDTLDGPRPEIIESHRTRMSDSRIDLTLDYLERHHKELYDERRNVEGVDAIRFEPRVVVLHYTVIPTLEKTLNYFAREEIEAARATIHENGRLNVGIHFVVDRDGSIYGLYPETLIARHTIGLNHVAVGIENIGDGDLCSDAELPMTDAQVAANVALVKYLAGRYPSLEWAIGHQEYRDFENPAHPGHELFVEDKPDYRSEKSDPGDCFMTAFRRELTR